MKHGETPQLTTFPTTFDENDTPKYRHRRSTWTWTWYVYQ